MRGKEEISKIFNKCPKFKNGYTMRSKSYLGLSIPSKGNFQEKRSTYKGKPQRENIQFSDIGMIVVELSGMLSLFALYMVQHTD